MILVRFILIGVALFLIARSLMSTGGNERPTVKKPEQNNGKDGNKKVSKKIGEYVDYEDINK